MRTHLFGTDGIRGRAYDPPLDDDTVRRLGVSLSRHFGHSEAGPRFLLAGDTRESTVPIAEWLGEGLQTGGGVITWAGVLPTPAVSHLLRQGRWDAGIVISASHNPAADNGIKVLSSCGEKIPQELEVRIESDLPDSTAAHGFGLPKIRPELTECYRRDVLRSLPDTAPLAGRRFVLDAANGAGSGLGERILSELGADVVPIASAPNGSNINDGVGAAFPDSLATAVRARSCDGGLALDGDADRAILVDEKGCVLDGDDILLAWARALHDEGRLPGNKVVATVMSNFGLEATLRSSGISLIRCPVGDRAVRHAMVECDAALGGEQSGHIICSHFGVTGDGILTGIHLLTIAARSDCALSELSGLVRLPQILLNVPVGERRPFDELPKVQAALRAAEERLGDSGRVLLRYSGTEPLARVMLEGEDQAEITMLAEAIAEEIRGSLP